MCSEDIVKLLVQNKADANIQNQVSLVKICRDLKAHCVVFTWCSPECVDIKKVCTCQSFEGPHNKLCAQDGLLLMV